MNLLAGEALIAFAENLLPAEVALDEARLPPERAEHWLQTGVARGNFKASRVLYDGAEVGVIYWHLTDQRDLYVNGIVSHAAWDCSSILSSAVDKLGRLHDARDILVDTKRPGMARKLMRRGYEPTGIALRKPVLR
jgi:hypothetical protein